MNGDGETGLNEDLEVGNETVASPLVKDFRERSEQAKKVEAASKAIFAVALLFILGGSILGYLAKERADEALAGLKQYADDELLELVTGETVLAGDLRKQVKAEPTILFVMNYSLAALYFGLFFWSKRSPFPAVVVALVIYCGVQVGNAVIDPNTIYQAIVVKVIVIVILAKGLSAALAQRKDLRVQELKARATQQDDGFAA